MLKHSLPGRLGLALGVLGAAGGVAAQQIRQPVVAAGPYRVMVDRITQNRTVTLDFALPGGRPPDGVATQRSVQFQVAVLPKDPKTAPQISTFQVKSVTVRQNNRPVDVHHYGGPLESPNDPALVRAYLYVPAMPANAQELNSIEGEIVSYERNGPFEIEIPTAGDLPRTVEKDGVKVTIREWVHDGASGRLIMWVEAPNNSLIVNSANDGSYGVALINDAGRTLSTGSGTMLQVRSNQAEYRMNYFSIQGKPTTIRLRFLHRAGARQVYPFKLENITVPPRPKGT